MGLVFIVDYESGFFLLVATFLIITFPIFLLLYKCIYGPNIFRQNVLVSF